MPTEFPPQAQLESSLDANVLCEPTPIFVQLVSVPTWIGVNTEISGKTLTTPFPICPVLFKPQAQIDPSDFKAIL